MRIIEDLKKYLKTVSPYMLVIVVLFVYCIILTECKGKGTGSGGKDTHTTDTIIERVYDSIPVESLVYVPKWYERIVYVDKPTTIYQPVDSAAILAAYMATYLYADTIMNDTSAFIAIYDSITQNQNVGRHWKFINRRPTEIKYITMIEDCKKWNIGLGGFFGGNLERFDYGLGLIVTTNNRASYQAEYCFSDKSVRVGYYFNLRK